MILFDVLSRSMTFASEVMDNDDSAHMPCQFDRCHALISHWEAVQRYCPRWYRKQKTGSVRQGRLSDACWSNSSKGGA